MSSVATASVYARRLVESEAKRAQLPLRQAIPRVARKLRLSNGSVFNLLFKLPKRIDIDVYNNLQNAVLDDLAREIGALQNEMAAIAAGSVSRAPREIQEMAEDLADLQARMKRRREAM